MAVLRKDIFALPACQSEPLPGVFYPEKEEIDGMDLYTNNGFADTFRYFYANKTDMYSWWSYRAGARTKNVGWRIDYFFISESLKKNIVDAFILKDVMGSDHCPIGINIKF